MNPRHPRFALLVLAAAAVLVTGCGVETDEASEPRAAAPARTTSDATAAGAPTSEERQRALERQLPRRPSGTVAIAGRTEDSLVRKAAIGFRGDSTRAVRVGRSTEARAYADLCAGRVDAIEVTSLPSQAVIDRCAARGIVLVDPLQLASDAIVLATKNASDIGGDCITVRQANEIYRSGSEISNWAQLGFDDLPLRATGREAESDVFQFFGTLVLGRADATLSDVRSDYIVHRSDPRERREVTNTGRLEAAEREVVRYRARLRDRTAAARRRDVALAERAADRRVLRQIEAVNARNRRRNVTVDAERLVARNRRLVENAKRDARRRANATYDRRLERQVAEFRRGALLDADRPGTVGAIRFSYYELFEEQLRPLEIDFGTPETESGQPVRFGDLRDADQRRLAARVAAANPSTAGPGATTRTRTSAATIDPETPLAGIDGLPARDREGKRIYTTPNCVFPAQTTITSGVYPLTQRFFVLTSEVALRRAEVKEFLDHLVRNSRSLATDDRLVPITDQQLSDELTTIRGTRPSESEVVDTEAESSAPDGETATTPADGDTATTPGQETAPAPTTPAPSGQDSGIPGVSARD